MNWSPQQERALIATHQWLAGGYKSQQVFRLFGYAGTGKTSLALELTSSAKGRVIFATYTGKAAHVMKQRGVPFASTIHKVIYKPAGRSTKLLLELEEKLKHLLVETPPQSEESPQIAQLKAVIKAEADQVNRPSFILNPESELHDAALIVIDECSMVDERMGLDLLSFGKPVLVLGDPAQLPPVRGEGFFTSQKPDVSLTEIHRQALDSPVLRMATAVRNGEWLTPGDYGQGCFVGSMGDFTRRLASTVDQTLVGRNATRRTYNQNHRANILGFKSLTPCVGDRLVCLRNNHDIGLLNGQLWKVESVDETTDSTLDMTLQGEEGNVLSTTAHSGIFTGVEIPWWARKDAEEFDYGYALTVHKSQGSQWDNVLILDESTSFRDKQKEWLYTAITRAAKSVTILR